MSNDEQAAQQLPVASHRPAADPNLEEVWKGIERAQAISRKHNREVLRDHVGASTATALTFSNQLLHAGLLSPGPETEYVRDEDEGPQQNPPIPGTP